ncbi:arrestin domain-containing protein 3-like [Anneissia japonica]|uniref:arrestin domain-containing protein 3-like n=1 Tax=Anneissia japonica TaxID=1529436 RepID=UPI0014256001|nr:arrestin domain-containing protein 3-like [Anneissia japonica]XP_033112536.1 arrestin domain-containing protein 3-like [Anneissia japonica]
MKLQLFQIILDQTQAVYAPGNVVSGRVDIAVEKDVNLRLCEIHFKGLANVHWSEQHSSGSGKNRHTRTVHYRANEDYFNVQQQLLVKGANNEVVLSAGHHCFPFSFQLPHSNLPTTFEGAHGWVRYYLEAVLDETWWKFNKRCKVGITVISPVDCNANPVLLNPMRRDETKEVCCCCCATHINASFEIQRQAYCAGESIVHTGEVNNGSSRDLEPFIELYQRVLFKATRKTRKIDNLVCKISEPEIGEGKRHGWNQKPLLIPPIAPTLTNCSIIEASYFVRLHVDIPMAVDCRIDIPVLIGTIPANVYSSGYNTQYGVVTQQPSAPPVAFADPYPNLPPPSYASCVFGAVDMKEEDTSDDAFMGSTGFVPMYTYYGQPPPASTGQI